MGRLAWSQLRFRSARALALLLGMGLAATAFTVLTAASRTSQLRTVGTVPAHFRPAYDILVRPKGARTELEADMVFLNIRERAAELATIRSFGWRESALARLVVTEGTVIGMAGSLMGAALGLALAAEFAGQLPAGLFAAAAVAVGVLVTAAAALLPAQLLRRPPSAHLLAEE